MITQAKFEYRPNGEIFGLTIIDNNNTDFFNCDELANYNITSSTDYDNIDTMLTDYCYNAQERSAARELINKSEAALRAK